MSGYLDLIFMIEPPHQPTTSLRSEIKQWDDKREKWIMKGDGEKKDTVKIENQRAGEIAPLEP